jgi:hypothetical protein
VEAVEAGRFRWDPKPMLVIYGKMSLIVLHVGTIRICDSMLSKNDAILIGDA